MTLDQLANIAEIVASALVIVSLIYVGVQVGQNTRQQRADALRAAINDLIHGISQATESPEGAANFRNGLHDFDSMSPNERARFHSTMLSLTARYGLVIQLHDARLLDDADFLALQRLYLSIFKSSGTQQWWSHIKAIPPAPLRDHLDQAVKDSNMSILQVDHYFPWLKNEK